VGSHGSYLLSSSLSLFPPLVRRSPLRQASSPVPADHPTPPVPPRAHHPRSLGQRRELKEIKPPPSEGRSSLCQYGCVSGLVRIDWVALDSCIASPVLTSGREGWWVLK
jgi:hypothetical protein